jgi:hypothetical protein
VNALHLPPYVAAAFARMDAAEAERDRREQIDRRIEAEDRRAAAAADAERFELHHGYSITELFQHRSAAQEAATARDAAAEYGSERRPEILIDGQALPAREQVAAGRSRESDVDRLLARARSVDRDGYMARMVAEYDQRQQVQRSRERQAQIRYHESEAARLLHPEVTRDTSMYDR